VFPLALVIAKELQPKSIELIIDGWMDGWMDEKQY
jgi:hypothetical protein